MVQEDEHGPDGAYLHPSMGGEAIMLSSSLAEEDDADADLAELRNHASMGKAHHPLPHCAGLPVSAGACHHRGQGCETHYKSFTSQFAVMQHTP